MSRLGTVTLQALDDTDVFLIEDIFLDGERDFGDIECHIPEPGFQENTFWVTGEVPSKIPVCVEGDTSVIYGWFKGDNYSYPYLLKIYIEYEEVEELNEEEKQ